MVSKVQYAFCEYTKDDLKKLEPEVLAGVLRERVHHNIEVPLYPTLLKWKDKADSDLRRTGADRLRRLAGTGTASRRLRYGLGETISGYCREDTCRGKAGG